MNWRGFPNCEFAARLSLPPPQPIELTALALVRSVIGLRTRQRREAMLLAMSCVTFGTGRGLGVAGLYLRSRAAPHRQIEHFHLDNAFTQRDADAQPDAHRVRGLHAFASDLHLAAADRLRRERARLEQAHMPQPLVDAVTVVVIGGIRVFHLHIVRRIGLDAPMSTKAKLVLAAALFVAGTALQVSSYRNTAVAASLGVIVAALLIWAELGRH